MPGRLAVTYCQGCEESPISGTPKPGYPYLAAYTPKHTTAMSSPDHVQTKRPVRPRYFYTGAAVLLFVLMFVGFQLFYLQGKAYPGRPLTPPIRTVVILHGISMTAWMILFLVQPLLIEAGNRRLHMTLGKIGAALAALVVVFGVGVALGSARVNPPEMLLWGLNPRQFMAVPLVSMVVFAVLVSLGIWYRMQPGIHRPMMLLSVLAVMPAALDRVDVIRNSYAGTVWGTLFGPFFASLVIGVLLLVLKTLLLRKVDRTFAVGLAVLSVISLLIMQVAPTPLWAGIASMLLG